VAAPAAAEVEVASSDLQTGYGGRSLFAPTPTSDFFRGTGHTIPISEAPHTPAPAGHRTAVRLPRPTKETNTKPRACPAWTADPSTGYPRTLRHRTDSRQSDRAHARALETQGVGGSAAGHWPFGGVPPAPERSVRPDVGASLAARTAGTRHRPPTPLRMSIFRPHASLSRRPVIWPFGHPTSGGPLQDVIS
jgi:hypothetical protein